MTLREFLRIAWRRKVVLLVALTLTPAAAAYFSMSKPAVYEAGARVLLTRQDLGSAVNRIDDPTLNTDAERDAATQSVVARDPVIVQDVAGRLKQTDPSYVRAFLARSHVDAEEGTDILRFGVLGEDRAAIVGEVNAYAEQYAIYRQNLSQAALRVSLDKIEARLAELKRLPASSATDGVIAALDEQRDLIETLMLLRSQPATVVEAATRAVQVAPSVERDIVLGIALGLLIGFGLAFLIETLDTRVRTGEEIAGRLGLPLLGRLPEPPKAVRSHDELVMIAEPTTPRAEAFRALRTNVDFADLERRCRSLMVTSAVASEGKSTTIANLAVAMARAGRRVCLVDLDLRRPYLANFFGLVGAAGLTDVALGHTTLDRALHPIAVPDTWSRGGGGAGPSAPPVLDVLPSGPVPSNPGEFIESHALAAILGDLGTRYDLVLVDAPPMLSVGDPLALSARVDGIILVARLNVMRRPMANELRRLIGTAQARVLGVIVTGAQEDEGYGYGYGYQSAEKSRAPELEETHAR
jgi:capsular exopolysaccharide synthesis family protein